MNDSLNRKILITGDVIDDSCTTLVPENPDHRVLNISSMLGGAITIQRLLECIYGSDRIEGKYLSLHDSSLQTVSLDESEHSIRNKLRIQLTQYWRFDEQPLCGFDSEAIPQDSNLYHIRHSMLEECATEILNAIDDSHGESCGTQLEREEYSIEERLERCRTHSWRMNGLIGRGQSTREKNQQDITLDWRQLLHSFGNSDAVIINDEGLEFRRASMPTDKAVDETKVPLSRIPWITYKCRFTNDFHKSQLWEELSCKVDRLIAFVRAEDIRNAGIDLSRGISWEKTCTNWATVAEMTDKPKALEELLRCKYVVISFPYAGAIISRKDSESGYVHRLVFDSRNGEGEWEKHYPGMVIGVSTVMVLALTSIMLKRTVNPSGENEPDPRDRDDSAIIEAVRIGLGLSRFLHVTGFEDQACNKASILSLKSETASTIKLEFPIQQIARLLVTKEANSLADCLCRYTERVFSVFTVPNIPEATDIREYKRAWTILGTNV